MMSFFRGQRGNDAEREPLLPRHNHDTALQTGLDKRLQTYRILKALSEGYMPSNEQIIAYLHRKSDALDAVPRDVSGVGRALTRDARQLLEDLIALLQNKNGADQIQDFFWYISQARLGVDTEDIRERVQGARPRADVAAGKYVFCIRPEECILTSIGAYTSLSTVGSLALTNSEFRVFLGDITTIGREVFRDAAFSLSAVSKEVGKEVAPADEDGEAVKPLNGDTRPPPSTQDLENEAVEISSTVADGASKVAKDTSASVSEHVSSDERRTLAARLKQAALKLRRKPDYTESVSILSLVFRRYLKAYSRAASETIESMEEDVERNRETDRALWNFWKLITSIGDTKTWEEVDEAFKAVMGHAESDPDFERHVDRAADLFQAMLTDPDFYDDAEGRFAKLRDEFSNLTSESDIKSDVETLLHKLRLAISSATQDEDMKNIANTAKRTVNLLSRGDVDKELVSDCIHFFGPMLISAIQHIPIPRLEVSTPVVDLLLENLILEPGKTINSTSFLPQRVKFVTQNEVEVFKGRARTTSQLNTFVRVSLSGISVTASDVGYWLRYHSGLLRFGSEGIASLKLDNRGIDIVLDLEIGRDRIDELLSVRNIQVRIHRFDYTLDKSRISWLAWLFKPLLRPIIRTGIESRVAASIRDACASANRELLFARERLRAARVAGSDDMWTFVRAVCARLVPRQDPNRHVRVGIDEPGTGVFKGVYAPGSVVKIWNEEGSVGEERIRGFSMDGWRNTIFDI